MRRFAIGFGFAAVFAATVAAAAPGTAELTPGARGVAVLRAPTAIAPSLRMKVAAAVGRSPTPPALYRRLVSGIGDKALRDPESTEGRILREVEASLPAEAPADHLSPALQAQRRVERATLLETTGRSPEQIVEGFVTATGAATLGDGKRVGLPDRRLFVRTWHAVAEDGSGKLVTREHPIGRVVISPGYSDSQYTYAKLADRLTREGYEVTAMDHTWTGFSEGHYGEVGSPAEVVRNVATVVSRVGEAARAAGAPDDVVVIGHSYGGFGAIGAASKGLRVETAAGELRMPERVGVVPVDAYLGQSRGAQGAFIWLGKKLLGDRVVVPPTTDARGAAGREVYKQRAAAYGDGGYPGTANGIQRAAEVVTADIEAHGARGPIAAVHARRDPTARYAKVKELVSALGDDGRLTTLHGRWHVVHASPDTADKIVDALAWMRAERGLFRAP